MPDIQKCNGHGCPWKNKCWRHIAPNSHWQSWGPVPGYWKEKDAPDDEEIWVCEMFWPVDKKGEIK